MIWACNLILQNGITHQESSCCLFYIIWCYVRIICVQFRSHKVCCDVHYRKETCPRPSFRDVKGYLIVDAPLDSVQLLIRSIIGTTEDVGGAFFSLDFLLLDELLFLSSDSLQKNTCRFVIGILRNQFALNSHL